MGERLRLTEILTTGSAVANYRGVPAVRAVDVLDAIAILQGHKSLDDLGRPQSPLLSRVTGAGSGASPAVRDLAQRWFVALGSDAMGEFESEQLDKFEAELRAIADGE